MTVLVKFQIKNRFSIELHGNSKLSMTSCPPSFALRNLPIISIALMRLESFANCLQRVMSHLVERYVASKTAADVSVEADISIADIRALRNDLLALK